MIEILVKECEKLGVQLLRQTPAKKILTDSSGKVKGVLAVNNNQEIQINAKSVIIATGGYGGNKELLRKYCPDYSEHIRYMGLPHMGDGIQMTTDIGAANEGLGMLQLQGPVYERARNGRSICMEPVTVWVNNRGERFTDESTAANHFECVNAMLQQPGKVSYTLFDEEVKQDIVERINKGYIGFRGLAYRANGTTQPDLISDLQLEAQKKRIKISDSWEEIAQWIGAAPEVLKATINEYNSGCDHSYDELFTKDRRYLIPLRRSPYYCIRCYPIFLTTMGGIKINHKMQVIDKDYEPIPGLFAAGNDTGGWEPKDTYNAILSGHAFGFAINSGRIAGENAAEYVNNSSKDNIRHL